MHEILTNRIATFSGSNQPKNVYLHNLDNKLVFLNNASIAVGVCSGNSTAGCSLLGTPYSVWCVVRGAWSVVCGVWCVVCVVCVVCGVCGG